MHDSERALFVKTSPQVQSRSDLVASQVVTRNCVLPETMKEVAVPCAVQNSLALMPAEAAQQKHPCFFWRIIPWTQDVRPSYGIIPALHHITPVCWECHVLPDCEAWKPSHHLTLPLRHIAQSPADETHSANVAARTVGCSCGCVVMCLLGRPFIAEVHGSSPNGYFLS